jgi:hypothetical protein
LFCLRDVVMMRNRWTVIGGLCLLLLAAACGGDPTPVLLREATPTVAATATVSPSALPPSVLALAPFDGGLYTLNYPSVWEVRSGAVGGEQLFVPADDPFRGMLVRVIGPGYDPALLDAIINNEVVMLGQERLAPNEIGVRRAVEARDGSWLGRMAELDVQLGTTVARMRVIALVMLADPGESTAYVLRMWVPVDDYTARGYAVSFDAILYSFTGADAPAIVLSPTRTPSPTIPPVTATPAAAHTTIPPTDIPPADTPTHTPTNAPPTATMPVTPSATLTSTPRPVSPHTDPHGCTNGNPCATECSPADRHTGPAAFYDAGPRADPACHTDTGCRSVSVGILQCVVSGGLDGLRQSGWGGELPAG